jgi:chemotaxis protein methyltransferase WspC
MSRQALVELLACRIGLDPESLGERVLTQSLQAAADTLGLTDLEALYRRVQADKRALQALIEQVVVPETWLLRGRDQFDALVEYARSRGTGTRLRVLSLPCASGEEAWSIAASLYDAGFAPTSFHVTGIDVSERAIALAEAARYRPSALRGATLSGIGLLEQDGALVPHPDLCDAVSFRVGNALDPAVYPSGERYDVIFCRNLLIYLEPEARRTLVRQLLAILADGGVVFTGQAENLAAIDAGLAMAPAIGTLAFVRAGGKPRAPTTAQPPVARAPSSPKRPRSPPPASATHPVAIASPDPLAQARALADRGELEAARRLLRTALASEPTQAACWRLLGLIEMARDALAEADEAFAHAIFLDREDAESLRHRAILATRLQRPDEARRLQARWERRGDTVR